MSRASVLPLVHRSSRTAAATRARRARRALVAGISHEAAVEDSAAWASLANSVGGVDGWWASQTGAGGAPAWPTWEDSVLEDGGAWAS
ncbi:hypothetical protein C8J57DRAFT_1507665 [Mycena rebaudengoi]|nr:hypothetical protein C8J57DRAFT_1507665 [Mycena rebaudengoi]